MSGAETGGKKAGAEQIVEPADRLAEIRLEDLPVKLRQAAARAGWTSLMPVQAKAIPYIVARRDLMIQSRTGSGKTGAFVLPILERTDVSRATCQSLVLVPTRELAQQVTRDAKTLAGDEGVRVAAVYGGVAYGPQFEALRAGAHVVVGTPGRILDHLLKRTLSLGDLGILVFDEADRMLSMGFYPDMREIQKYLPSRPINGYMFSATFPPFVLNLAGQFLRRPEFLSLSRDRVHVAEIEHVSYKVPAMEKDRALVRIIEVENPHSAIIFCNTKARVHYVALILKRFGYDADELSADLTQGERDRVLERVRRGALRFLVATDVAARGIDIPTLTHIVQYEPPEDPEAYVHRAGRTGRAGASGEAISLITEVEAMQLEGIARTFGIDIRAEVVPTDADVEVIVAQRVTALLEARLRTRDRLQEERSRRFIPLARGLADNEDELPIIAMLLDDYYQLTLHAPVVPPEVEEKGGKAERKVQGAVSAARGRPDGQGGGGKRRRRR